MEWSLVESSRQSILVESIQVESSHGVELSGVESTVDSSRGVEWNQVESTVYSRF